MQNKCIVRFILILKKVREINIGPLMESSKRGKWQLDQGKEHCDGMRTLE